MEIVIWSLVLLAPAHADQQFKSEEGFAVCLPDDWVEIPAQVLEPANKTMSGFARFPQKWSHAYQLKNPQWLACPYIFVRFKKGRLDEAKFKRDFLYGSFQRGLKQGSGKIPGLLSETKVLDPSYDPASRTVENVIEANLKQNQGQIGSLTSYSALRLTEQGVIMINGCCTAAQKDECLPIFRQAVQRIQMSQELVFQPRLLDGVPILGAINWSVVVNSCLIVGIVGGLVGFIARVLKKFSGNS
jgi:hypothetical protein